MQYNFKKKNLCNLCNLWQNLFCVSPQDAVHVLPENVGTGQWQ